MKSISLSLTFAAAALACSLSAQISLLQSFNSVDVAVVNLDGSGTLILERQGEAYYLYDLNQVLVTIFTPPQDGYLLYISNTLFDTDPDNIEYMVHGVGDTWIFRTDSTELFHLEGSGPGALTGGMHHYYDQAITNTENGAIMRLWEGFNGVKVYQLPGCLYEPACSAWDGSNLPAEPGGAAATPAYPNPTAQSVTIPYTLPAGVNAAELVLCDMAGNRVAAWKVGSAYTSIRADLGALPAGTYLSRLTAGGAVVETQQIILVR